MRDELAEGAMAKASPEDAAQASLWSGLLCRIVDSLLPPEDVRPGAESLMATALLVNCARLVARCPQPLRGQAVEQLQQLLASVVADEARDLEAASAGDASA